MKKQTTVSKDMTGVIDLNFSSSVTPQPYEQVQGSNDNSFVYWGIGEKMYNLYPNFLLKLYNDSPLHKGIINGKIDYITGDGIRFKGKDEVIGIKPNDSDSFDEFINKIINDYLIFNAYAIEVVYNKLGRPIQWVHIPFHKLRMNRDRSRFWYGYDWQFEPSNYVTYDMWKPGINKDGFSKVYYYSNYAPSVLNVYPTPEYSGAIKAIENDIEIREFHINNIRNSFSPSSLITFYTGGAEPERADALNRKIQNAYTGSNGKKFILGFESPDGKAPSVQTLTPSDADKMFIENKKDTIQDILTAHMCVSPMLFGIKTEGQLGGATELESSYEIFKNIYVKNRRNELETSLNRLFADAGFQPMEFKDSGSLFSSTLSDIMKMKTYTINEVREKEGLPPILNGDRLIDEVKPVPTQEPQAPTPDNGSIPDVNVVGSPIPANQVVSPSATSTGGSKFSNDGSVTYHLTDDDFEKVKHLGKDKTKFTTLKKFDYTITSFSDARYAEQQFDDDKDVADYIIKSGIKNMTIVQIKAAIRKDLVITVTADDVRRIIQELEDSGMINKNDLNKSITVKSTEKTMQPEKIRRIETRYSYDGIEDDRNRPFCAKLLENDRYYSRSEIQEMSLLFGYDVFSYRGGFYHNPTTNITTPYCRHRWTAVSVVLNTPEE